MKALEQRWTASEVKWISSENVAEQSGGVWLFGAQKPRSRPDSSKVESHLVHAMRRVMRVKRVIITHENSSRVHSAGSRDNNVWLLLVMNEAISAVVVYRSIGHRSQPAENCLGMCGDRVIGSHVPWSQWD